MLVVVFQKQEDAKGMEIVQVGSGMFIRDRFNIINKTR